MALSTLCVDHSFSWGCPVHHGMFSRSPGLYPLHAKGTHSCCDNQKYLQTFARYLRRGQGGTKVTLFENHHCSELLPFLDFLSCAYPSSQSLFTIVYTEVAFGFLLETARSFLSSIFLHLYKAFPWYSLVRPMFSKPLSCLQMLRDEQDRCGVGEEQDRARPISELGMCVSHDHEHRHRHA